MLLLSLHLSYAVSLLLHDSAVADSMLQMLQMAQIISSSIK